MCVYFKHLRKRSDALLGYWTREIRYQQALFIIFKSTFLELYKLSFGSSVRVSYQTRSDPHAVDNAKHSYHLIDYIT